ncbi:gas vesicle protein GvpL [Halohasta salina]|uniref:gas vesicle protein GvpL n=1 Tax=Halohasta salina TaxID=2961621 RepID=UPI0020A3C153|nr:GvpL/GvpF family gas vesicle protein [Halohasta salina]
MTEIDQGRYLYCLVYLPSADYVADPDWSTEGIADEPVSVVTAGDVGAVVHACDSLYDTDDPQTIQQWLLSHQRVVDEASEAFGTPIPFQFDTILTGGDEALADWLETESDRLEPELSALAGHREYRVEITHHEDARSEITAADEALSTLRQRIDDADSGTAYLLEQQYETEITKRLRQHRRQQARSIADRIAPHVAALESLGTRRSTGVDIDTGREDEPEPIARLAVLATDEGADALGEELDSVAAEPGVEVRFTGPWPPYTFAPTIDSQGGGDGADR